MNYREIKISGLYECTEILGIAIRNWNRSERVSSSLKIECPILNNHDLFVVLEESCFTPNTNRAHLKVLTTQGIVGWIAYIDKPHLVEIIKLQL